MELTLTDREAELLRFMVEKDIHELLMEIANTDHRDFREQLKAKEEILQAVREKLTVVGVA